VSVVDAVWTFSGVAFFVFGIAYVSINSQSRRAEAWKGLLFSIGGIFFLVMFMAFVAKLVVIPAAQVVLWLFHWLVKGG
jgi:hypothetical protein